MHQARTMRSKYPMRSLPLFLVALSTLLLSPTQSSMDARSNDLLGQPFEVAVARFGPPESGGGDGEMQTWTWRNEVGKPVRLSVHAGVVVHVDPALADAKIAPRTVPAEGAYPSQPVAELVARLGNPERVSGYKPPLGPSTPGMSQPMYSQAALVYGERHLLIAAGRVLGVWVRPPDRQNGPR